MTSAFEDEFARLLTTKGRKRRVEHRPFVLPSIGLSNPKFTARKMEQAVCRLCMRTKHVGPPHITRHHLVPESWFLGQPDELRTIRNAHANIIPLCRSCHDEVDNRGPVARERARRKLRGLLSQEEITFAIQVRGRTWLEIEYPDPLS